MPVGRRALQGRSPFDQQRRAQLLLQLDAALVGLGGDSERIAVDGQRPRLGHCEGNLLRLARLQIGEGQRRFCQAPSRGRFDFHAAGQGHVIGVGYADPQGRILHQRPREVGKGQLHGLESFHRGGPQVLDQIVGALGTDHVVDLRRQRDLHYRAAPRERIALDVEGREDAAGIGNREHAVGFDPIPGEVVPTLVSS